MKPVGHVFHAQIFKCFPRGISRLRVPPFRFIEMCFPLLYSLVFQVELPAIAPFPFGPVENGKLRGESAIGSAGAIHIAGEFFLVAMSSLHDEDGPFHVPCAAADFDAVLKGVGSSCDRPEEPGFRLGRIAPSIGAVPVIQVGKRPIAK